MSDRPSQSPLRSGPSSRQPSPSSRPGRSTSQGPSLRSPSPQRLAALQEMGRMGGTSRAEQTPTPAGRADLLRWMDVMPLPDSAERPYIKAAAIAAFDKVMKRKADEAQKFWYEEGLALGRGWTLDHALSGMTTEDQRKGLRAGSTRRSRTYHESVRGAFERGVWAGFEGARQNMHRTVPRSWSGA